MIHNSRLSHGLSSQHHHDWIWLNSQDIQDIPGLINSCHGIDSLCQATCSPHELDYGGSKHHESGWAEGSIHGEGLKYPEIFKSLTEAAMKCQFFVLMFQCLTLVSASWATTPARVQDRDDTILRLRAVVASRFAGKVAMAPPQVHRSNLGQRAVSIIWVWINTY